MSTAQIEVAYRPSQTIAWSRRLKRTIDLSGSIVVGLLSLPLLVLIYLAVKATSTGPAFYCQRRIGRQGRHFHAWKFRTMIADAGAVLEKHLSANPELRAEWERNHKLRNDPRITWIGGILRKTSLDELPQIWNVIRGEMSLVGPRPIVDEEVEKYGTTYRDYLSVLPGITGLWQVSGRNDTTYQKRVQLDRFYVRNWSIWLDLYILIRTIRVVVLREGAY